MIALGLSVGNANTGSTAPGASQSWPPAPEPSRQGQPKFWPFPTTFTSSWPVGALLPTSASTSVPAALSNENRYGLRNP
jgi:hypothetical protein